MNNKFDELTKSLAQSVTRRAALKKFGVGLAGMALASFGLADRAHAAKAPKSCSTDADCRSGQVCCNGSCMDDGSAYTSPTNICGCHLESHQLCVTALPPCAQDYGACISICSSTFNPPPFCRH